MENSRGPPRKWSHVVGISRDPTNAAPRLRAEVATGRWRTPTASRTRSSDTAKSHEPTGRPDPIPRPGSAVVTLPVIGYTDHCADGGQLFGVHRRRRIVGSVTPTIDATSTLTWWWLVKRPHPAALERHPRSIASSWFHNAQPREPPSGPAAASQATNRRGRRLGFIVNCGAA